MEQTAPFRLNPSLLGGYLWPGTVRSAVLVQHVKLDRLKHKAVKSETKNNFHIVFSEPT